MPSVSILLKIMSLYRFRFAKMESRRNLVEDFLNLTAVIMDKRAVVASTRLLLLLLLLLLLRVHGTTTSSTSLARVVV